MYTEAERAIFGPYPRGDGTEVYADPLRVRRRLKGFLDGDVARAIAATKGPHAELALEAMERLLAAAVRALDLVPFDPQTGAGVREDQVVFTLNAFLDWEERTRDFFAPPPTPAGPTAPASWGDGPTT